MRSREEAANRLTYEVITDGNIEQCRELCNELMAFQKSKATMAPELFDLMNFDTRMKRSYESAEASHVVIVKDGERPIGYVFSTIERIADKRHAIPEWAPGRDAAYVQGFYPDWEDLPDTVGCLSNLYVKPEYRAYGIGSKLFELSMAWLEGRSEVGIVFIYVSNGNDAALDFYLSRGFAYSHDVFGGFIKAVYKWHRSID